MNSEPNRSLDELLTEGQAADLLKVSVRTLQSWRWRGGGPVFIRLGGKCVRYQRQDLTSWLNANRLAHTSQGAA